VFSICIPKTGVFAGYWSLNVIFYRCFAALLPVTRFMYYKAADGPFPFYWSFIEICSYQHVTASRSFENSIFRGEGGGRFRAVLISSILCLTGLKLLPALTMLPRGHCMEPICALLMYRDECCLADVAAATETNLSFSGWQSGR
jgi:hypothetical protein